MYKRRNLQSPLKPPTLPLTSRSTRVKLKGVELPSFSGEDKTEFEAWDAAFISVVDDTDIPVKDVEIAKLFTG